MARSTTGHAATDHLRIIALAGLVLEVALRELARDGGSSARWSSGERSGLCWSV